MKQTRVVRISLDVVTWMDFRLECLRIGKPGAWVLAELVRRWVKHQQVKEKASDGRTKSN